MPGGSWRKTEQYTVSCMKHAFPKFSLTSVEIIWLHLAVSVVLFVSWFVVDDMCVLFMTVHKSDNIHDRYVRSDPVMAYRQTPWPGRCTTR